MVVTLVEGGGTYMLREEETAGDRIHAKPTVGYHRRGAIGGGRGDHLRDAPLALSKFDGLFAVLRDHAVHQRVGHVAFDAAVSLLGRE
jgi:hypothetical protein